MQHQIKLRYSSGTVTINDKASLAEVEAKIPLFFKTPHGKREVIVMYHGFLIVRNTVSFDRGRPQRMTKVYLYTTDLEGRPDTLCVSNCENEVHSIAQAKLLIDRIIKTKTIAQPEEFAAWTPTMVT